MWGVGGGVRSVPGIVGSVVGRRPHTGVRLGRLINQKSHVIRLPELCAAPPKRCNSNDAISMFEIHVGELRATFLRNHNMRRHKDPTRKTSQAEDSPSPKDPRNPDSRHNRHKHGGGAPVMWRCTRTEEVHCLRIGCSAPTHKNKRGTGTPNHSPPHPSMHSWALLAAAWARRPRRHLHSGPLRPNPAHSDTLTCEELDYLSAYSHPQVRSLAKITCRNAPTGAPTNPALEVPQTSSPQLDEPQINEIAAADPMGDSCGASGPEPAPNGASAQPGPEEAPAQPTA